MKSADLVKFRLKWGDLMRRQDAYESELKRWMELFADTDDGVRKAAMGLIEKAAYTHSLCVELQEAIDKSGAIKVHPENPELQKTVPAVKEFARLSETYANIVNKLNSLRAKNVVDSDDELAEFI
jgi:hypothetical protein